MSHSPTIHPTAIVDPTARLGAGVVVGPHAVIEREARVGDGTTIGASAYIGPWTTIGRDNRIYHHASVGSDSQALAYNVDDRSFLEIGDANIVREFVTLNRSSNRDGVTRVGSRNCFMAYSHVAHDCVIGDHTIFANSATIGGYVTIEDHAVLGGLIGVHQFCRVGAFALVGHNSKINKDVLPFLLVDGHPARPYGVNVVGLRRNGFDEDRIYAVRQAYKALYYKNSTLEQGVADLRSAFGENPDTRRWLDFIADSQRGLLRPRKGLIVK